MSLEITDKIVGYHYTNPQAYSSMQTNGVDGYTTFGFDNFAGLIPMKRLVPLGGGNGLPHAAHDGIIEALLEPLPASWVQNPEFPNLWGYLMGDICRKNEVILLSFELRPEDNAYVVERAHVERELYRNPQGNQKLIRKRRNQAFKKYWESRVPVFEYDGSYATPQLAIWSGIEFERLRVEWIKPTEEVWQKVLDNNW